MYRTLAFAGVVQIVACAAVSLEPDAHAERTPIIVPAEPAPSPVVRMVPLRVGDRVRIDSTGEVGAIYALDCGDSDDHRMVVVRGIGRPVRDGGLTLLEPAP